MRRALRLVCPAAAVAGALAAQTPAQAACGRVCLTQIADAYLAALLAHRPARARLAADLRLTENARPEAPGDGLWRAAEAIPARQVFADTERGQAVVFGVVRRGGRLAPLMVRLRVVSGRIREAEMMTGADVDGPYAAPEDLMRPDVLYDAPVPAARASSREILVRIADAYFTALERHDGSLAPFSERCDRYEAGARVTNSTRMIGAPDGGIFTCAQSLEAAKGVTVKVAERRYPVADPAHGLVVAIDFLEPQRPDGSVSSLYLAAVFKVVDGRIRQLDEINTAVAPGARTGFGS